MTDYSALRNAVIGSIPEDRNLWRINWLKSLLDAFNEGELRVTDKCDDPEALCEAIRECRDMIRDVNFALADCSEIIEAVETNCDTPTLQWLAENYDLDPRVVRGVKALIAAERARYDNSPADPHHGGKIWNERNAAT